MGSDGTLTSRFQAAFGDNSLHLILQKKPGLSTRRLLLYMLCILCLGRFPDWLRYMLFHIDKLKRNLIVAFAA